MPYFALAIFVMPACLGAINVVVDALVHLLWGLVSTWLNCVVLMRKVKWKKRAQEPACWHYQNSLAADASIHFLQSYFFVWLDRVASSRNLIKTIDFSWFSADRVPRSDRSDRISPQRDMHYFALAAFVMPARSGAINLAAEALIHFLQETASAWLNCVALMRNMM